MKRIILKKCDVLRQTYRASGPGGQHRNKTETAVRLTHVPTGVVAQCCSERSQSSNNAEAWTLLRAKLDRLVQDRQDAERQETYEAKPDASFGEQIRSYFLDGKNPRIIDHRTGATITIEQFRRGKIDGLLSKRKPNG